MGAHYESYLPEWLQPPCVHNIPASYSPNRKDFDSQTLGLELQTLLIHVFLPYIEVDARLAVDKRWHPPASPLPESNTTCGCRGRYGNTITS